MMYTRHKRLKRVAGYVGTQSSKKCPFRIIHTAHTYLHLHLFALRSTLAYDSEKARRCTRVTACVSTLTLEVIMLTDKSLFLTHGDPCNVLGRVANRNRRYRVHIEHLLVVCLWTGSDFRACVSGGVLKQIYVESKMIGFWACKTSPSSRLQSKVQTVTALS